MHFCGRPAPTYAHVQVIGDVHYPGPISFTHSRMITTIAMFPDDVRPQPPIQ
jgi:hypothetical protein